MYGQIISFLFVILIIYYVVMILLDIQKAKAAKAAELEKNSEEEIDISDEAQTFKPVLISREEPNKATVPSDSPNDSGEPADIKKNESYSNEDLPKSEDNKSSETSDDKPESSEPHESADSAPPEDNAARQDSPASSKNDEEHSQPSTKEKPFRREGYREAAMTGGLDVDTLLEEVDQFAETGKGPLGQVILDCRSAHF